MAGDGGERKRKHVRAHKHGVGKKPMLDAVRNEINITPLVDVCLVLLIIFMVVTPLMARGQEVQLAKTLHHASKKDAHQPVVAIDRNDKDGVVLYYDKQKLGPITDESLDKMKDLVQRAWEAKDDTFGHVYVKAAAGLPYSEVYKVLISLNEDLNIQDIDLATQDENRK
jgi:biopolymer transport protein ExbD